MCRERGDLLDEVMRWREGDDPLRVLVLTGAGGFGKTRMAVEVCVAADDAAHAVGQDPAALAAMTADREPDGRLQFVRLAASLDGSAEQQFAHALAALDADAPEEAVWAMARCRDATASWERPSFRRRLDEYSAAHPDVDVTLLGAALAGEDQTTYEHSGCHGSITSGTILAKSRTFRVTTTNECANAVAAISASTTGRVRPERPAAARSAPHRSVTSSSTSTSRPSKRSERSSRSQPSSRSRRRPGSSRSTPSRSSPSVMTDRWTRSSSTSSSQRTTFGSGTGFVHSDTTFVSSR